MIRRQISHTTFKFGNSKAVHSYQKMKLPVPIGPVDYFIETKIVNCPSKEFLKRANTFLDVRNDKVVLFGQPIYVHLALSVHYCVLFASRIKDPKPKMNLRAKKYYAVSLVLLLRRGDVSY